MPVMTSVKGALQNYVSNAKSEVLKVHYRANYASNAKFY